MTEHHLSAEVGTIHGKFSPDRTPIMRIQPGDTIVANTLDAGWGLEAPHMDATPRAKIELPYNANEDGHCLVGPIWIEGAKPGMTLVVSIEEVVPGSYGFTFAGGFPHRVNAALGLGETDGSEELVVWTLDAQTMIGTSIYGQQIKLKPFLGVMGVTPPEPGFHPTPPPRKWGGNIDCKDLTAGTRLYLPIAIEGGLFSFGDGHAAQGHGELSVTAIEAPMERVRLTFELSDQSINMPRAWTPSGWITFGFDESLEKAALIATGEMLTLMTELYPGLHRQRALALSTAVVDLYVTQIANPNMGVHAFLAHDAFLAYP